MICVAATNPFGYDALAANWQIANDIAAEQGRTMDPSRLRLVGPMHIAETRAKAFENCRFGFERYLGYLNNNQPRFIVPPGQDAAEWFVENKFGVIGTPDDAIALIERLRSKQGEFGVFLHQAHNWADWEATKRSYELYARYVMPHFSDDNIPRIESFDWCTEHRDELTEKRSAAARAMFDKHEAEQDSVRRARRRRWCGRRRGARLGDPSGMPMAGVILAVLDHPAAAGALLCRRAASGGADRRPPDQCAAGPHRQKQRSRGERGDAHRPSARRSCAPSRRAVPPPSRRNSTPGCRGAGTWPALKPSGSTSTGSRSWWSRSAGSRADYLVIEQPARHDYGLSWHALRAALFATDRPVLSCPPSPSRVRSPRRHRLA